MKKIAQIVLKGTESKHVTYIIIKYRFLGFIIIVPILIEFDPTIGDTTSQIGDTHLEDSK